jgi:hypothetical protein
MFLRATVAAMTRWRQLTSSDESDRGDSPVPTVIIWIGVAGLAIALITWAGLYIQGLSDAAPKTVPPVAPIVP